MTDKSQRLWRIGALLYVTWGVIHLVVGSIPLLRYMVTGPTSLLAFHEIDVTVADGELAAASRVIAEGGANLIAFGLLAIIVGVALVAPGRPLGFWVNALVLGIVDASFVLGELVPGHRSWVPDGIGPVLYVAAVAVTAVAMTSDRRANAVLMPISR